MLRTYLRVRLCPIEASVDGTLKVTRYAVVSPCMCSFNNNSGALVSLLGAFVCSQVPREIADGSAAQRRASRSVRQTERSRTATASQEHFRPWCASVGLNHVCCQRHTVGLSASARLISSVHRQMILRRGQRSDAKGGTLCDWLGMPEQTETARLLQQFMMLPSHRHCVAEVSAVPCSAV